MQRVSAGIFTLLLSTLASAQGRGAYFNVETPQVEPITVARIAGHDYLLVCNTPDNSVEVWDTDETLAAQQRFLRRIPVGIEPCSILWNRGLQCFYTADFLSDSVTRVSLTAPSGPPSLTYRVEACRNLQAPSDPHRGDEPMDLALTAGGAALAVTFQTKSYVGLFDPVSLAPLSPDSLLPTLVTGSATYGLKEPRSVESAGDRIYVIGNKGGRDYGGVTPPPGQDFDFDLWVRDMVTQNEWSFGGLGTTNSGLAVARSGDVFVVGGIAQNHLNGQSAVAAAPTGFVQSALFWIRSPGSGQPVLTCDLNLDAGGPVARNQALAQPTDVVVLEADGQPTTVIVAAFGSDRLGFIVPDASLPVTSWQRTTLDLTPVGTPMSTMRGPRGLALKPSGVLGPRLYVLNRISHTVSIVDPTATPPSLLGELTLNQDPTPAQVKAGRPFLYSARLSGSGFVSCASCHVDARTDQLAWDLGETGFGPAFPPDFADGPAKATVAFVDGLIQTGFDKDKGFMVTQSLQGLLNYDVDPAMLDYVTNAPLHWRGDRATFEDFNEAFAGLLGGSQLDPEEMEAYRDFVHTIVYPPNPEQPLTRQFSGELGDPNGFATGSGAQLGLKVFHQFEVVNGRSCVQCHFLPEGSNNKFTVASFPNAIESAAMRGLFQKERRITIGGQSLRVGSTGLLHLGGQHDIDSFIAQAFSVPFTGFPTELAALQDFVREFDWSAAPMIGQLELVAPAAGGAQLARLDAFEAQARVANVAVAARGWFTAAPSDRGYRCDSILDAYVEEGTWSVVTRAALLASLSGADQILFVCTPLGMDRRVADVDGDPASLPASSITAPEFLPMVPDTAYADVPAMIDNWPLQTAPPTVLEPFEFQHPDPLMPTPLSLKTVRLLQFGLMNRTGQFGVTGFRHEAPRRFRVAAQGLQPGARMLIETPNDPAVPIPPQAATIVTARLLLELFPTAELHEGKPVWETAVELDPAVYLTMMNGGPFAPGVASIPTMTEPPATSPFDPDTYNWHRISLANPGQPRVQLGWQRLELQ